jgi:lipid A 1-phosphatase
MRNRATKPANQPSIWVTAYRAVQRPIWLILFFLTGIFASASYPTDLHSYPMLQAGSEMPASVNLTEDYLRFVPTIAQIAVPLVLGDKIGIVQLVYVGISNTIATQGTKFLLNNQWVRGTRLGQRPRGLNSKFNMPSGHSSMVSCAVWFLGRRYGWWLAILLSIFMLMTMYARVMLNAHTISAVIAGALTGFVTTAWFTSRRERAEAPAGELQLAQ